MRRTSRAFDAWSTIAHRDELLTTFYPFHPKTGERERDVRKKYDKKCRRAAEWRTTGTPIESARVLIARVPISETLSDPEIVHLDDLENDAAVLT
jgi:hypothetical protein